MYKKEFFKMLLTNDFKATKSNFLDLIENLVMLDYIKMTWCTKNGSLCIYKCQKQFIITYAGRKQQFNVKDTLNVNKKLKQFGIDIDKVIVE